MRIAFKMAFKNLIGAGLRTWLNVSVLAFCFIVIVFYNGFINGWQKQGRLDAVNYEFAQGQLFHANYDPYDVFTVQDAHGSLSEVESENLTPVLIQQATLYPNGRMNPILIKGIPINQDVINLPIKLLAKSDAALPVLIGKRMAEASKIKLGDNVLLRWRDKNGTYDATSITIAGVFDSDVPTIDVGQVWMSLKKLRELTGLEDEATLFIANENYVPNKKAGWKFQNLSMLLKDFDSAVQAERIGSVVIYLVLLAIGLLAIFDTQVLSIFRRQREIGTYIALGMTKYQVLKIFTVEGGMYSIFAGLVGLIVGTPLFYYTSSHGINLGNLGDEVGARMARIVYPSFGIPLIIGTLLLLVFSATLVSFLPARKISKMNTVDALKGKMS
ncbi:MAG: FtsX-like permease family protein [Bacteroidales bacterium]|jgi:ABC-type lipoprotein release transport system permease subunit|nr:FtsX-like permease family protein [Bacteroidales bacterium]MDY0196956.1 FtsX-like permease family protein [Tenuifilaceae bacterium]